MSSLLTRERIHRSQPFGERVTEDREKPIGEQATSGTRVGRLSNAGRCGMLWAASLDCPTFPYRFDNVLAYRLCLNRFR